MRGKKDTAWCSVMIVVVMIVVVVVVVEERRGGHSVLNKGA